MAEEAPYQLRAGDVVEIWVGQDPDLNRQITIQPDGRISLPLAGHLQAGGLTLEQLEKSLKERLQSNFKEPLDLTAILVSAAAAAPEKAAAMGTIYLIGDVARPGEYPLRSGMTVLHAVSLAGGYATAPSQGALAEVDLAAARRQLLDLIVQEARIRAEVEGKESITLPAEVTATANSFVLADIVRQQKLALDVWRSGRQADEQTRERKKIDVDARISRLKAQLDFNQQDIELRQDDLNRMQTLKSKGLATAQQEADLRRAAMAPQALRLQLTADLDQAKAELDEVDTTGERNELQARYQLTSELEQTKEQIAGLRERVAAMQAGRSGKDVTIDYVILRRKGDGLEQIKANELSPLKAGDLVQVVRRAPQPQGEVTLPLIGAASSTSSVAAPD